MVERFKSFYTQKFENNNEKEKYYIGELMKEYYKKIDSITIPQIKKGLKKELDDFIQNIKKPLDREKRIFLQQWFSDYLENIYTLRVHNNYNFKKDLLEKLQAQYILTNYVSLLDGESKQIGQEDLENLIRMILVDKLKKGKAISILKRAFSFSDEEAEYFYKHFLLNYRKNVDFHFRQDSFHHISRNNLENVLSMKEGAKLAEDLLAVYIKSLIGLDTIKTSDYDDWVNHSDLIVEIDYDTDKYLLIDTTLRSSDETFSLDSKMSSKLYREGQEINLEYFYDKFEDFRRITKKMPLMLIDWNFLEDSELEDLSKEDILKYVEYYFIYKMKKDKFDKLILDSDFDKDKMLFIGKEFVQNLLSRFVEYLILEILNAVDKANVNISFSLEYDLESLLNKRKLEDLINKLQSESLDIAELDLLKSLLERKFLAEYWF